MATVLQVGSVEFETLITTRLREQTKLITEVLADPTFLQKVGRAAEMITVALLGGRKLMFCGNGGSAVDATHLAAEFLGRFKLERDPLPALSLADNLAAVTAIGNDYSYEEIFSRQVSALGERGDVLIGLSTSGDSANVVAALLAAGRIGVGSISFTGESGGRCSEVADLAVRIPSSDTARIQESYMSICHTICEHAERSVAESP